jgi:hypothetical protein
MQRNVTHAKRMAFFLGFARPGDYGPPFNGKVYTKVVRPRGELGSAAGRVWEEVRARNWGA